jgi:phospholipase C
VQLHFDNSGSAGAVFQVYDRLNLDRIPNRYTVEPGKRLSGTWDLGAGAEYDLWVLGPNGFHRHFTGAVAGKGAQPEIALDYDKAGAALRIVLRNDGSEPCRFTLTSNAYFDAAPTNHAVGAGKSSTLSLPLAASKGWYDYSVDVESLPGFSRRFAGRLETGAASTSDPAMHGSALGEQHRRA